jgi:amino acid transporter
MKIGESAKDRRVLVREAGFRPTSGISVFAGICAAVGLIAVAAGVAAAVADAAGMHTDAWTRHDWRVAGTVAAAIAVVVVFGSFMLGGYTAGRMSRRMGFRHGVLMFLFTAVAIAVVGCIVAGTGAWTHLRNDLANHDVPVGWGTWSDIGVIGGIALVAAMLLGSLAGGMKGDRWHTQLTAAAARNRARTEDAPQTEEAARPTHELGRDATTIDLRDETEASEPSVEEERENARAARADVGL